MGSITDLCHQFNTFLRSLSKLQQTIDLASTDLEATAINQICEQVNSLQQQFQPILAAIEGVTGGGAIAPAAIQRIRGYQTEAHRRLRLISIESMRLRTARRPILIERGRSQLLLHLDQLQQFTQAMSAEVCKPEDTDVS